MLCVRFLKTGKVDGEMFWPSNNLNELSNVLTSWLLDYVTPWIPKHQQNENVMHFNENDADLKVIS